MRSTRSYGDGCSSAHALDLIGDRWALLIVRDLLFGPKRFGDLHAGLPQISPNVLSQRLRDLEGAGVVERRKLPAPASAMVYGLTEWGAGLEPVLMGLQRWGAGSPQFDPTVPVGCDAAMLALKNAFRPEAAGDARMVVEVRFPTATFGVTVADAAMSIARGTVGDADAVIETDPTTLEEVVFGLRRLAAAEKAGRFQVHGDRSAVERLLRLFPPPPS